jgi:WD40 repeat protein
LHDQAAVESRGGGACAARAGALLHGPAQRPPCSLPPLTLKSSPCAAQVNALQLNHDGTLLATCGNDKKVTTWSMPDGHKAKELSLDGWIKAVAFSRGGEMLAAGGATSAVHVWDVPSYAHRHALPHEGTVNAVAFSSDGSKLASGGMDKCVRVWDTATGAALHELSHEEYVLSTNDP